jgi:SAM-dependent methyltransferase
MQASDSGLQGFRANQLGHALALINQYTRGGSVLDIGTGSGWFPSCWPDLSVGVDIVASRDWDACGLWALASADALPFQDGTFANITAFGVLGAFSSSDAGRVMAEIRRVLTPFGRAFLLVSCRHPLFDLVAPHRVFSGWRWSSFSSNELRLLAALGELDIAHLEQRGGPRTLVAEWLSHLWSPFAARGLGVSLHARIGELDLQDFQGKPRDRRGRYLYLVLEKRPNPTHE